MDDSTELQRQLDDEAGRHHGMRVHLKPWVPLQAPSAPSPQVECSVEVHGAVCWRERGPATSVMADALRFVRTVPVHVQAALRSDP